MAQPRATDEQIERQSAAQLLAAEIVKRVHAGDKSAEKELVELYYQPVMLLLQVRCHDNALAEDICHDTLALVIEKLRKQPIDHPERLGSFVRQVAHNLFISDYRRQQRQNTKTDTEFIQHLVSEQTSAEYELQLQQLQELVQQLVDEMPKVRDQQILRMHYLTDLQKPVICKRLDLSSKNYDRVIFRARNRLREIAEEKNILQKVGDLSS